MTRPAERARNLIKATYPNAVVAERRRGGITMTDPDTGNSIEYALVGNRGMHYGQSFENEIDTDWVQSGPGWEMNQAEYNATLQGNTYSYTDVATGESVNITLTDVPQWVNDVGDRENAASLQSATPSASGDVISYDGILGAGTLLEITTHPVGIGKKLHIPNLATFNTPTLTGTVYLSLNFRFQTQSDIYIDGQLWAGGRPETLTASQVVFGNDVFIFPVPFATDANQEEYQKINGTMNLRRVGANLFAEVRIPYSWLETATYPIIIDPTVTPTAAASGDDADEREVNTAVDYTGNDDSWRDDTGTAAFYGAARWAINASGTVNTSYIRLRSVNTSADDMDMELDAEAADSAADFTSGNGNISARTMTGNSVNWTAASAGTSDYINSPSLNSAIQAVFDRAGWSSGNYIAVVGTPDQDSVSPFAAESYDASGSYPPAIYIDYTAGGGRTTKNKNSHPLGYAYGVGRKVVS